MKHFERFLKTPKKGDVVKVYTFFERGEEKIKPIFEVGYVLEVITKKLARGTRTREMVVLKKTQSAFSKNFVYGYYLDEEKVVWLDDIL